jgi:L-asparagine transporter-like permease
MITTVEDTSSIARYFFAMALNCQVTAGAFDASQFYMAVVFSVAVSLIVCALCDVPFLFGRLEFNFALLKVFHVANVLIVSGGFEFDEKRGKWKFVSILFDVPNI